MTPEQKKILDEARALLKLPKGNIIESAGSKEITGEDLLNKMAEIMLVEKQKRLN
jgi:hypothetical protein